MPDFGGDNEFLRNVQEFLKPFGLYYVQVHPDELTVRAAFDAGDVYHTIEGMSPRGHQHACVGLNGKVVFDPHPYWQDGSRPGLDSVDCYGLLCKRFR